MLLGKASVTLQKGAQDLDRYERPLLSAREVLLVMEGRADANELAAEILPLRANRSRGYRILPNVSLDHMLTMAVLRNRLLLPGAGITLEIIKRDEEAVRLVKPTG